MMRHLVYLIEFIAIVIITAWLFVQPGALTLDWGEYHIETQLVTAFLGFFIIFIMVRILFKTWRFIVLFPTRLFEKSTRMRPKKGIEALTQSILATALHETDTARQEAKRFERFLGGNPIYQALLAYNYLNDGKVEEAIAASQAMKDHEAGDILSWYFQARIAIIEKKDLQALECLQRLFQTHNKSPWVVKNLLKYSLRLHQFAVAQQALKKVERMNLMTSQQINQCQALILYHQAQNNAFTIDQKEDLLERAHRLAPELPHVAIQYSKILRMKDKLKRAKKMIEHSWASYPHPDLIEEYLSIEAATSPKAIMDAVDHVVSNNPNDEQAYLAMAKIALNHGQWGRARAALHDFQERWEASQDVCHLMAQLELMEHGDQTRYREWMERALKAERTNVKETTLETLFG